MLNGRKIQQQAVVLPWVATRRAMEFDAIVLLLSKCLPKQHGDDVYLGPDDLRER